MSNIREILGGLFAHYASVRQVGYTTDAIQLCKDKGYILVTANQHQANYINQKDIPITTLASIGASKLRGYTNKILLDNFAIMSLVSDAISHIDGLEDELEFMTSKCHRLENQLSDMDNKLEKFKTDNLDLRSQLEHLNKLLDRIKEITR